MKLDIARAVADAVLLEGYALYPYRASAPKNRFRWAFGVLVPQAWAMSGGCESYWLEAQILVAGEPSQLAGQLRFFQIDRRRIENRFGEPVPSLELDGDRLVVGWDEGILQTIPFDVTVGRHAFTIAAASSLEAFAAGRVGCTRLALTGRIEVRSELVPAERPLHRISIRVENTTPWTDLDAPREEAIAAAFASTHLILGVTDGELLSLIDPPDWARDAAAACRNTRTFPVLVGAPGTHEVMLSAPFIMYDHPEIAPESPGDLCDATEIDEILTLRTMTMTEEEKRHARATDPRAARIIDRADSLPPKWLERMHGAARDLRAGEMVARADAYAEGTKVRLRPTRGTDAQDLLYAGHVATVAGIRHDVDGTVFLLVTIDDDPAAELHDWYGRYHYYRLDEVEPP